jgi:hypothetical protein
LSDKAEKATRKYAKKYQPEVIGQRFAQSQEVALTYHGSKLPSFMVLRDRIENALRPSVTSVTELQKYFYFGERALKLRGRWSGYPLYLEAALEKFKWNQRGLDNTVMNTVLRICGIGPENLPIFAGGAGGDVNVIQWGGTAQTGFDLSPALAAILSQLEATLTVHVDNMISGFATETTLSEIAGDTDNLATIAGKDFSTETTLAAIRTLLGGGLPAALDGLSLKVKEQSPLSSISVSNMISNFALETGGNLANIYGQLDVKLSTVAKESGGNLATIAGKDFATQTTLASVLGQLDVKLSTVAKESGGYLQEIAGDTDALSYLSEIAGDTDALSYLSEIAGDTDTLSHLNADLSTLATESTLNDIETDIDTLVAGVTVGNWPSYQSVKLFDAAPVQVSPFPKSGDSYASTDRGFTLYGPDSYAGGHYYPVKVNSDGSLWVTGGPATPTTIGTLADLTGNSAAQRLIVGSTPCKVLLVRALAANTGQVRVGDSNVSASRGAELSATDFVVVPIDDVNKAYFYGVSPDKVSVTYVD